MKRYVFVVIAYMLVAACTVVLTSVEPARADQASVNACGKTIARESGKVIKFFGKKLLGCYTKRHKCAASTGQEKEDCLDKTELPGKVCSCEAFVGLFAGTGTALAKAEAKIAAKCDYNQVPAPITMEELLDTDPMDPRRNIGYRDRFNCMCGFAVGDQDGDLESYEETAQCRVQNWIVAAISQIEWDTDPRAADEIFDLIAACMLGISPNPCV